MAISWDNWHLLILHNCVYNSVTELNLIFLSLAIVYANQDRWISYGDFLGDGMTSHVHMCMRNASYHLLKSGSEWLCLQSLYISIYHMHIS